jgi:predicted small secreted protein
MENGQYANFMIDCTQALNTIYFLRISIYSDGSGNNFALDSSGNNIENRLIANISYTYPYIDSDTQIYMTGVMNIHFDDDTFFENDDEHETSFWYSLEGMEELGIKQFT